MRRVAWFAFLAVLPSAAHAAPRSLSLDQAKHSALAHNPTLGRADQAIVEAAAAVDAFDASLDTQLAMDATARGERVQPRQTPFTQLLARDQTALSAAVSRVFRDGGEARFGVGVSREVSLTRLQSQLGHDDLSQTTALPRIEASLRQPLWGGRRAFPANASQLVQTRRAVSFDQQTIANATLREVTRAYWELYLAQREVAIRGEARGAAQTQLRQVEAEIARGARAPLAAIEIEDALGRLREDELIAIGAVAERSVDLSRAIGLTPTTELRASDVPADLESPATGARAHAPRLIAAEARALASHAELDRTVDDTRWRIDAVVSGSLAAPRDTLRVALDDTASYGGWTVEVGLSIRGPLSDRLATSKRAGAHARWTAARLARREIEAELAAEIERLENRRAVARERRRALVRAIELAEQNLRAERNRWDRGDTTSFELLRRQATLAETRLRLERARVDELSADAAISAVYGSLRS